MKRRMFTIMSVAFAIVLVMSSCKKEKVTTQSDDTPSGDGIIKNAVTDIDGNTYDAVKLGNQVWMAENLRTTRYADGTPISLGRELSYEVAYHYYPADNSGNVGTYGYLYNWPAVMGNSSSSSANPSGVQGICPTGWHVPSDAEWTQLTTYVKSQPEYVSEGCSGTDDEMETYCITKALSSTTGWDSSDEPCTPGNNPSANNATGFSAVPTGNYEGEGDDGGVGHCMNFWTATQYDSYHAYAHAWAGNESAVVRYGIKESYGFCVRCVRD